MSAVPHSPGSVQGLFSNKTSLPGAAFQYEQKESRTSYQVSANRSSKKGPAPKPPAGLGQYKPKILSATEEGNLPISSTANAAPVSKRLYRKGRAPAPPQGREASPYVVGDKDTPLVLHPSEDEAEHVSDRVNSRLLSAAQDPPLGTDNPLFLHQQEEAGVEVGGGHGNHHQVNGVAEPGEPEGVFIPEPDYEEEEKTLEFQDEEDQSGQQVSRVYKEYQGDDFGQYLSDEETFVVHDRFPRRSKQILPDRKSKTEAKRTHYKKRESIPKGRKDKNFSGAHSLRDFTFADSKYGTVSNNNNSKKRHSLPSLSESVQEAEHFLNTSSSYEQFLCSRHGDENGILVDDQPFGQAARGLPEVPPRYAHHKDNLWKKLTWRFRKPSHRATSVDLT